VQTGVTSDALSISNGRSDARSAFGQWPQQLQSSSLVIA
jgi:hypothetical protein